MRLNIKNFGLLETIVIFSLMYVIGMLLWTVSTRPAVEAKANLVKENHKKVVDFINNEVNQCGNSEDKNTVWGDPCNSEWIADKVVRYINNNLEIKNIVIFNGKIAYHMKNVELFEPKVYLFPLFWGPKYAVFMIFYITWEHQYTKCA